MLIFYDILVFTSDDIFKNVCNIIFILLQFSSVITTAIQCLQRNIFKSLY